MPPNTIAIRNPHIRDIVFAEQQLGTGRNATEVAENLILEAVERRRLERAAEQKPARRTKRPA